MSTEDKTTADDQQPAVVGRGLSEWLGSAVGEPTFLIKMNLNRIECDAWIDRQPAPDGGWVLIGMGRRTEYDIKTGALISDKVEPTGLRGWAPAEMFGETRRPWWRQLFASA